MELYLGGFAQGKLQYVNSKQGNKATIVIETAPVGEITEQIIWNQFHLWFRKELQAQRNPEEQVGILLKQYPDLMIIADEVGNGIVPMDAFERAYRERLGRCLCVIAQEASIVERIICGLGSRLK